MALFKSRQIASGAPIPTADRYADVVPIPGDWTVPTGLAAGDVVEMCGLPAGYVPVDLLIDNQALGATVTADVGIVTGRFNEPLNLVGAARDCGAEFISAAAMGTAGIKRPTAAGAYRIAPAIDDGSGKAYERSVGMKLTTVTTPTVGATVRFTLLVRPMLNGA